MRLRVIEMLKLRCYCTLCMYVYVCNTEKHMNGCDYTECFIRSVTVHDFASWLSKVCVYVFL